MKKLKKIFMLPIIFVIITSSIAGCTPTKNLPDVSNASTVTPIQTTVVMAKTGMYHAFTNDTSREVIANLDITQTSNGVIRINNYERRHGGEYNIANVDAVLGSNGKYVATNGYVQYILTVINSNTIQLTVSGETLTFYLLSTSENEQNIAVSTDDKHEFIGSEYACCGRIVDEDTINLFGTGTTNVNQIKAMSEAYLATAPDYKTSNGLKPQQALDLISAAYDTDILGTVNIYSDYIEAKLVEEMFKKETLLIIMFTIIQMVLTSMRVQRAM